MAEILKILVQGKKTSTESMIKKLYLPSHRPAAHLLGHRTFLPIPLFQTDFVLLFQQHSFHGVDDAIP